MRRRTPTESSAQIRSRVTEARQRQLRRFAGTSIPCNAQMPPDRIARDCRLSAAGEALLKGAFDRMGLTARSVSYTHLDVYKRQGDDVAAVGADIELHSTTSYFGRRPSWGGPLILPSREGRCV